MQNTAALSTPTPPLLAPQRTPGTGPVSFAWGLWVIALAAGAAGCLLDDMTDQGDWPSAYGFACSCFCLGTFAGWITTRLQRHPTRRAVWLPTGLLVLTASQLLALTDHLQPLAM